MECLLDDSVNSNLLSNCPNCRDTLSDLTSCQNCQRTIQCAPTNKNSRSPVTHHDIVTPPSPDLGTHPSSRYDESSLRPCLPGHIPSMSCPECDAPLVDSYHPTVAGEGCPAETPDSPNRASVRVVAEVSHLSLTDTTAGRCARCGRFIGANLNSLCSPPHRTSRQESPAPSSPHDNQYDVMAAPPDNQPDMDTPPNNQHDVMAAPTHAIPGSRSHCHQNEKASPALWGRYRYSNQPSSRSHLDLNLMDIDIFKSDLQVLRSTMEDTTSYPSPPHATLLGHSPGSRGRASMDTRSPPAGHRSRRTLLGSGLRPTRQSLLGVEDADGDTSMDCIRPLTPHRPLTPSRPLTPLPQELLYELHDLDHENEDLSADVVHSLNLRNYEIKQVLGKGISSTVRRVVEKTTGQEFAVKIIDISGEKGEVAQVEQTKKDTYREIRILRMCGGHPNIIELHDVFETPTFIFLVFEICKKGELFDYLTSVVSLSEKRTRIFMRQLLEAVEFFHRKNIVHRDLKPENILLDDNLNIKVSDFGFATVVEPGEELVELCGTPGYLAPEVLAHSMYENVSGYGKEVDMWACGVIMYTLLCGAPPFWNRRQMMMLRAIMNADYTFNSPEWDDISDPPKNLIQKLLLVNPQQRLTAKEALAHPFFHSVDMKSVSEMSNLVKLALSASAKFKKMARFAEEKKFDARRKFRAGVFCVVFYLRLNFSYKHPPPISADTVRNNPYGIKVLRKVIDSCAFGMYRHWVKRVDNQNRAALFEHTLRDDWKHSLMTEHGIVA